MSLSSQSLALVLTA